MRPNSQLTDPLQRHKSHQYALENGGLLDQNAGWAWRPSTGKTLDRRLRPSTSGSRWLVPNQIGCANGSRPASCFRDFPVEGPTARDKSDDMGIHLSSAADCFANALHVPPTRRGTRTPVPAGARPSPIDPPPMDAAGPPVLLVGGLLSTSWLFEPSRTGSTLSTAALPVRMKKGRGLPLLMGSQRTLGCPDPNQEEGWPLMYEYEPGTQFSGS